MKKLIECVPNVSEGLNKNIITQLAQAIESVPGSQLLDVDPGQDTNRTVFTFVGDEDAVLESAFLLIKKAAELIDMRKHQGKHPRMGATDVCPFIPLENATMQDCIAIAKKLATRVGNELQIPVYLYEEAATLSARKSLSHIRQGEYEALGQKLLDPCWIPDAGPAQFGEWQQKTGATVIGARPFLIAYNVNLNTQDKKLAQDIALNIRESGRAKKNSQGQFVYDEQGQKVITPGTLKTVKATGWVIEEYQRAQISMNLTNIDVVSIEQAFVECEKQAQTLGLRVTGSEIVGLIPLQAMLNAGQFFLKRMGKVGFFSKEELIHTAILSLGLDDISKFEPEKKIIELKIQAKNKLTDLSVRHFCNQIASPSPAPGGGSVAALAGALSASLCVMMAHLSAQKKITELQPQLEFLGQQAQQIKETCLAIVTEDTKAFNALMQAIKLPKHTAEEKKIYEQALLAAQNQVIEVPYSLMKQAAQLLSLIEPLIEFGYLAALSDIGVALHMAATCMEGAYLNVCINIKETPHLFAPEQQQRATELIQQKNNLCTKLSKLIEQRLK